MSFSGHTFSSGLAATMAVVNILKSGDHIVCSDDIYGGKNDARLFNVKEFDKTAFLKPSRVWMTWIIGDSDTLSNQIKWSLHFIEKANVQNFSGTQRFLRKVSIPNHGLQADFVDLTKLSEVEKAFKPNTKVNILQTI